MTEPPSPGSRGRVLVGVGRVTAGVISCVAGVAFLSTSWLAVNSRFGLISTDMHGYGLLFGTLFAIPAALILAVIAPFTVAPRHRPTAYWVSLVLFLLVFVALAGLLLTA